MNKKISYTFRILAGAYLAYLGYSLIKGYLADREISIGFPAVGVLFVALGLFFCVTGLLDQRQAEKELEELEAQEEYDGLERESSDPREMRNGQQEEYGSLGQRPADSGQDPEDSGGEGSNAESLSGDFGGFSAETQSVETKSGGEEEAAEEERKRRKE